jgi:hypothetical protein
MRLRSLKLRLADGKSAYDAEAKALVYQAVEFGEFESASGNALARRSCALRGLAVQARIGHDENRVADPVLFSSSTLH